MSRRKSDARRFALCLVACSLFASVTSTARPVYAEPAAASPERYHYAGDVVDEQGHPLAGVTVTATMRDPHGQDGYGYIDVVKTDATGHFSIDRPIAMSGLPRTQLANAAIWLECTDIVHVFSHRDDLATLSADELTHLKVELKSGRTCSGKVVDAAGRPVENALVRAAFPDDWVAGKGTLTDAAGGFTLRGLIAKDATVNVLGRLPDGVLAASRTTLAANAKGDDLALQAATVAIKPEAVQECLGMKLATLDPAAAVALDRTGQTGVLVLDPGKDVERLDIGPVQAGDVFWLVGEVGVKTPDEFRQALLAAKQPAADGTYKCRVVYRMARPDFAGTNTQYIQLSAEDVASLEAGLTKSKR